MSQTTRKRVFYIMMLVAFVAVTIFEYLTPMLSDDIAYMDDVLKANNFFDLFVQEYQHYVSHTGRSISHIILRIFLFIGNKLVFDVVAGLVFVTMSILIYLNVDNRREYDVKLYGIVLSLMWFFDAAISDTVLWMDGACNYMFTGTIVMGFLTFYRLGLKKNKNYGILPTLGLFFFGVIAGWCNENTSGGLIAFIILELIHELFIERKERKGLKLWMVSGLVGTLTGFVMLLASPGNYNRLEVTEEEHTGIVAMAARFLKITINIQENYLVLLCAAVVLLVLLAYLIGDKEKYLKSVKPIVFFIFLFIITCYALIMVPTSELRSYYGASIFLMVAVANGASLLEDRGDALIKGALGSFLAVAAIIFVFFYFSEGAKLARIKREYDERDAYFARMHQEGITDIYAPMLRPQWETRFSAAYRMDISEDDEYWINMFYSAHYKLGIIAGVDRETWTEY